MAVPSVRARAIVAVSILLAAGGCGGGGPEPKTSSSASSDGRSGPAEVGRPAPDLTVQTLNGKGKISLESLSGKVAVVDFWATWCGPCKQSFPKLEELSKRYPDQVEIVGVSVDDERDGVATWAKDNGATFSIAWDEGHAIANRWRVSTMPTTYIVDATGTVRFVHAGFHDGEPEAIAKELASLVGEAPSGTKAKSAASSASSSSSSTPGATGETPAPAAAAQANPAPPSSGTPSTDEATDTSGDASDAKPKATAGKGKPAAKKPAAKKKAPKKK